MQDFYRQFCTETFDDNGCLSDFSLHYPPNFNFGTHVVDALGTQFPTARALVWCNRDGDHRTFTFGEIATMSNQAANVFAAHGIGPGDKVMLMLKRHYEYWIAAVALHKLGAIAVPVTHMLTVEDMHYRIDLVGIKAAVCTPEGDVPETLLAAKSLAPCLETLWVVQENRPGFLNLTTQMATAHTTLTPTETLATDPMLLYFTSGTTGYPKAVMHDHTYALSHIITAKYWHGATPGGLHFTVAETGWAKASWGKLYGQWLLGCAVMVFDFDAFEPKQLMAVINQYGVTSFCAPPTVYRYFVKKGLVDMPSLQQATTAGEALNPEVFRLFYEKTGLTLREGFGQTESTLILANLVGTTSNPGSMGKPTPLYHLEIRRDDGTPAQNGEVGEIVVVPPSEGRQHGIFMGYCHNDALYRHVWRGGVYHTGDAAHRDENGYFWYNSRIDDVIKTGGFRVGPYEIENVLMEHPAVLECSVVGVADELRGQSIKAFVILAPGHTPSPQLKRALREFANGKLAEYKWIRTIELVDTFPKTVSGKIRKIDLRKS